MALLRFFYQESIESRQVVFGICLPKGEFLEIGVSQEVIRERLIYECEV